MSEESNHICSGVIFDFDGVILDSAGIKTEAFLELFDEYPNHIESIRNYHIEHQGITRYQKFEWIYNELLNKEYTTRIKQKLGKKFSTIVLEKILNVDAIPGALDFLVFLKNQNIPAFISSGTPDAELKKILQKRDLNPYFLNVYGSNLTKEEAIDVITSNHNFNYSDLLFVGDAKTDYDAAKSKNVPFVAVYSDEMVEFWKRNNIQPINNLMDIKTKFRFEI